ncbi:hypothetical protein [Cellulomonas fengjieae]|uniref:Glycine zipper domain-containing protein n=1 Tax=Cellulomonas fengjieae TaxID=2819978 RepID=A0ABS3SIT8_9CELL|nr:hypothetical protein [Cellulomonas fengjieae]MBO3085668.1 hypothetical protein [Cellulomonas fengjieae]QVI67617.1 hypothetical protein KG102_08715 [Cellulomonas fengjieae]
MSGSMSAEVDSIGAASTGSGSSPGTPATGGTDTERPSYLSLYSSSSTTEPLILMPAGIVGDIVGSLGSTIGGELGGWFGDRALGKTLGGAAGELIKGLSPWSVVPPSVAPASAGPGAVPSGSDESLVIVPAGFITGLLGGVGGKLLGGAVGGLFGNKDLGEQIGGGAGGALGSFFGPFSVVPPQNVAPQSNGPAATTPQEAMVVVPAGWLGHLFGGVARGVGQMVGGDTATTVGNIAGDLAEKFVPWSALPPNLVPASAGPAGPQQTEDLVLVPAGWFGKIASTFGSTIGRGVGGWLGNAKLGAQLGGAAGEALKAFSVLPDALQPASAGPGGGGTEEDKLVVVPAGVIGGLLGSLGGLVGGSVGGMFGKKDLGRQIGDIAGGLAEKVLPWNTGVEPFSMLPPATAR